MWNGGNRFRGLDMPLIVLTVLTAAFGIVMISSAGGPKYVVIQTVAFILGIAGIAALMILDYDYLAQISSYLYIGGAALLVLVLIPGLGKIHNGARSWFELGPINFQPAEVVKIIFIISFARLLSEKEGRINEPKILLKILAQPAILCVLIAVQPDFGTASVFMFITFVMLFAAKLSWKYIVGGFAALAALCPAAWFFLLQDYQKKRIISVFNPESDPSGSGYHIIQSKIAVGSGKLFGTGLYKGSSQVNNLLPERHTDFIFSAVCEELGMVGAVAAVLLLTVLILRCVYIGINARNSLGNYICIGVAAMLIFQVFENIGMCLGMFPVTGITLPFFSYGGSSMLTTMLAIGLVMNVRYRCRLINF